MLRTLLIVTVVIGSAATAVAAIRGSQAIAPAKNITVIEMNNVWASQADLSVEACAKEDCSDTPQS